MGDLDPEECRREAGSDLILSGGVSPDLWLPGVDVGLFKEAVLRTHLNRHGVEPGKVVDRYGADGRGPSMYISDPEGNMIELKGPAREGIRQSAPR